MTQISQRRTPDYRSRAARWRLFVLVAALMTVLIAMNEARKPTTWSWLWNGPPVDEREIDTRLPLASVVEPPPEGAVTVAEALPPQPLHGQREPTQEAWRQIWNALESRERIQLSSLLRHGRMKLDAADEERVTWEELIAKLDRRWDASFSQKSLETLLAEQPLDPDAKRASLETTAKLEVAWSTQFHPTLQQIARSEALTDPQREVLSGLQSIVDRLAIADVRDDTIWRADDTSAWFRLVEFLLQAPMSDRSSAAATSVSHLQMYRQSDEYRGQLVTFSGTARLVYRVDAPKNNLGLVDYCLFWVQPQDGSNRPIVVYALAPPDGFAPVTTDPQKIHEPVSVTGYFFKRWVYRAGDGLNSVPLVVAQAPVWLPPPAPELTDTEKLARALGPWFWPVIVGGAVLLALFAIGIARKLAGPNRPSIALGKMEDEAPADPAVWDHLSAAPSVKDSLKKLEDSSEKPTDPSSRHEA